MLDDGAVQPGWSVALSRLEAEHGAGAEEHASEDPRSNPASSSLELPPLPTVYTYGAGASSPPPGGTAVIDLGVSPDGLSPQSQRRWQETAIEKAVALASPRPPPSLPQPSAPPSPP